MRRIGLGLGVAAAIALAGCMTAEAPTSGEFRQITTAAEFTEMLAGRDMLFGEDVIRFSGNRFAAFRNGELRTTATWSFENGQYCRAGQFVDGRPLARDCQVVEIRGDEIRFTRGDGSVGTGRLVG